MCVQWDTAQSNVFPVLNGVKQGAISSPVLFCVYLDDLLIRLKDANLGCVVGRMYTGSLAYADDLTLLAPTADAMRRMLVICQDYANAFDVSFNASKSKCLCFISSKSKDTTQRPCFFIGDDQVEYVDQWPHLGNMLHVDQTDSASILNRRRQLVGQINDTLCFFHNLNPVVQTELLYTYCSSIYGSVLWNLRSPELELICTAWRSAIRRAWKVPNTTHRAIVNALGGRLPLFEELCSRLINFHYSCLASKNTLVAYLARNSLSDGGAQFSHGNNIRFLCRKYSFDYSRMSDCNSRLDVLASIRFNCYVQPEPVLDFNVLLELLMVRDNVMTLQPGDCFTVDEVQDLINALCTLPN